MDESRHLSRPPQRPSRPLSSLAKSKIILQIHRTNRNTKFFPHPPRSPESLAGPLLRLTAEDKFDTLPEHLKQAPARQ